jgi:hypothetical protein
MRDGLSHVHEDVYGTHSYKARSDHPDGPGQQLALHNGRLHRAGNVKPKIVIEQADIFARAQSMFANFVESRCGLRTSGLSGWPDCIQLRNHLLHSLSRVAVRHIDRDLHCLSGHLHHHPFFDLCWSPRENRSNCHDLMKCVHIASDFGPIIGKRLAPNGVSFHADDQLVIEIEQWARGKLLQRRKHNGSPAPGEAGDLPQARISIANSQSLLNRRGLEMVR